MATSNYTNPIFVEPVTSGIVAQESVAAADEALDPLQEPATVERFRYLQAMFDAERDLQADARQDQDRDERFYNHKQLDSVDEQEMLDRGQKPSIHNVLKKPIDWMIGTERKTRMEYGVLPREADDAPNVSSKKKLMKYIDDVNKAAWERSAAFAEAAKSGLSWVETGVQDDTDGEPIFERWSSWRLNWYDSSFKRPDYSDARYHFTRYPLDLDIATAVFPDKKDELTSIAGGSSRYVDDFEGEFATAGDAQYADERGLITSTRKLVGASAGINTKYERSTVDLIVCWYRVPAPQGSRIIRRDKSVKYPALTPDVDGEFFNEKNELHVWLVKNGFCKTSFTTRMQTRIMVWADSLLLQDGPSPYRHNRIPFVPIYAYRNEKGNFYGEIRGGISAQEDINKRFSKLYWLLCARPVVHQTGAIDDIDEFRDEYAKPDGTPEVNDLNGIKFDTVNFSEAQAHIGMISMLAGFVKDGMVPDEGLGIQTNAQSGIAIQERKESNSITTFSIFDNYLLSCQLLGELRLSLLEQYCTEEKAIRITGAKGKYSFESVNTVDEQGQPVNDIVSRQADFIIQMVDFRDSVRIKAAEKLMEIISGLAPDLASQLFPLAISLMDFEDKDEFLAQMRKILGQPDPNEENPQPTPAEQAAEEERQITLETARAQLLEIQAKVKKLEAEAQRTATQVDSERVKQFVQRKGVEYDERVLKTMEAKTLSDIRSGDSKQDQLSRLPRRVYREAGLQSNNQM